MKRTIATLTAVIFGSALLALSPSTISYQAEIRDANNKLITSQPVMMKISILQSTPSGPAVYVENHSPTTDHNGLVNINIGSGKIESGTFEPRKWAQGTYFIRTDITNPKRPRATISHTSQLLSLAEKMGNEGLRPDDKPGQRYVGELYGGGVVFWVDHTRRHGLVVSMADLSTAQPWSNVTHTLLGTTTYWDGAANTALIIAQEGHTSSAAQLCADYTNTDHGTGIYSNWHLPSIAQLNHLWNNFYEVQTALANDGNPLTTPLTRSPYWSSSENYAYYAWEFSFRYGFTDNCDKYVAYSVRAVRAF